MNTVPRIKALAKEKGISQKHLCEKLGYTSRTYFNDVVKNKSKISDENLEIIAKELTTTVEYLKGEAEDKTITHSDEIEVYLTELKTRPEMKMLFSVAQNATKEDIEKAVKIIEALRGENNG